MYKPKSPLCDGQWHTVYFDKDIRKGDLYVDGILRASGSKGGKYTSVDTHDPFYVGGVPGTHLKVLLVCDLRCFNKCILHTQTLIMDFC